MKYSEAEKVDESAVITVGELRAAVVRVLQEHYADIDDPAAHIIVTDIIRDVFNHREPEWQIGDVVRDDSSRVWVRYSRTKWQRVGRSGVFPDQYLERPLTLLDSPWAREKERRSMRALECARDEGAPI